jgi:hypothetical protein
MKIAANDVAFRRGGFATRGSPFGANPPGHGTAVSLRDFSRRAQNLFSEEFPMPLLRHHKGMKMIDSQTQMYYLTRGFSPQGLTDFVNKA